MECQSVPTGETTLSWPGRTRGYDTGRHPTCFKCGQLGQYARGFAARGARRQQVHTLCQPL